MTIQHPTDDGAPITLDKLQALAEALVAKDLAMGNVLSALDYAYWSLGQCYANLWKMRRLGMPQSFRDFGVRRLKQGVRRIRALEKHPGRSPLPFLRKSHPSGHSHARPSKR